MSSSLKYPKCPIRKTLPFNGPWPGREHHPEVRADAARDRVGVQPLGRADRGHGPVVRQALAEQIQPERLRALLHRTGERPVPRHRGVDPVLEVELERGVQPLHHADRRRPRVLGVGQRRELPVDRPVEVEARVRRGRGRLPRPFADAPRTRCPARRTAPSASRRAPRRCPSPSKSNGTAPSDDTTSTTTMAPASFATARAVRSAGSRRSTSRSA